MKIHDISQPLGTRTVAWVDDPPPRLAWPLRIEDGDSVNVAVIEMSVHTGTHADGTLHYDAAGRPAGAMPPETYVGPAVVIDAVGREAFDADVLDGVALERGDRVLLRGREHVDETEFPARFAAITPALVRRLAAAGVRLVGTDSPSVDPVDSKSLDAHHALAGAGIAILENLVLADVRPGRYFLVALPLRFTEADSSPVRAVLIEGLKPETPEASS